MPHFQFLRISLLLASIGLLAIASYIYIHKSQSSPSTGATKEKTIPAENAKEKHSSTNTAADKQELIVDPSYTSQHNLSSPNSDTSATGESTTIVKNKEVIKTQFDHWQQGLKEWHRHYQTSTEDEKKKLIQEARSLLEERRAELKKLIQEDPQLAWEVSISEWDQQIYPTELQSYFEKYENSYGDYTVYAFLAEPGKPTPPTQRTYQKKTQIYQVYTYGDGLNFLSNPKAPFYGLVIDEVAALHEKRFRLLKGEKAQQEMQLHPERIVTKSNSLKKARFTHITWNEATYAPASSMHEALSSFQLLEIGDEIYTETDIYQSTEDGLNLDQEANEGYDVLASPWTEKLKNVLVIRVDFSDKTGDPIGASDIKDLEEIDVGNFWTQNSYGKFPGITATVTPTLRMPKTASYYASYSGNDNTNANLLYTDAVTAATSQSYNTSSYDIVTIVFKTVFTTGWAGLASVGGSKQWVNGEINFRVISHETGHNLGLYHADFLISENGILSPNSVLSYGNEFDVMGAGFSTTAVLKTRHASAAFKHQLNYLLDTDVHSVTTSNTYRIAAFDQMNLNSMHGAIRIPIEGLEYNQWKYFIDFRQLITTNPYLMHGISIYIQKSGDVRLIDTTPSSYPEGDNLNKPKDREDAPLTIGRTFVDAGNHIYITPIALGGTTPESIDVTVHTGIFPNNHAPVVSIGASATTISIGQAITLTATASDADGDTLAYYWNFDDEKISFDNARIQTKSWTVAGVYHVRCEVSDQKGGLSVQTISITVGTPNKYQISGKITEISTAQPIQNARVKWGSKITYTNADGDYILTNLSAGANTMSVFKNNTTFTASGFSNPVTVGPSKTNHDWQGGSKTISGTVKLDNVGVADVKVYYSASGGSSGHVTTTTGGVYTISGVASGSYQVYAAYDNNVTTTASSFTLSSNNVTGVNFNFTTSSISGTVKDSVSNLGIPAAAIGYSHPTYQTTTTGGDGTFSLSFVTGKSTNIQLFASKPEDGYALSAIKTFALPSNKTGEDFLLEQAEYTTTIIEPFAGGKNSYFTGMNQNGDFVGHAEKAINGDLLTVPLLWKADTQTKAEIGNFSYGGKAVAINNNREVIGYGRDSLNENHRAFYWSEAEGITYIPAIYSSTNEIYLTAINNSGVAVGYRTDLVAKKSYPILWSKSNGIVDLGLLGGSNGAAYGINDNDEVVGVIDSTNDFSFYWSAATNILNIGNLGKNPTLTNYINARGEIAGYSRVSNNDYYAFIWDQTNGMKSLGALGYTTGSNVTRSNATGLNAYGEVFGFAYNSSVQQRPFLGNFYDGLVDLGTLGGANGRIIEGSNIQYLFGVADTMSSSSLPTLWRQGKSPKAILNLIQSPNIWALAVNTKVNDQGQILTTGLNPLTNEIRAMILKPIHNLAPFAIRERIAVPQNTYQTFTLKAIDPESQALTFTVVSTPSHGTLSGTAPNLTYTPTIGYTGTDTFTFKCSDGLLESNIATVTFVVAPGAAAIVASTDQITVNEGGTNSYKIRLNQDPGGSIIVTTTRLSGDTDLNVSSGSSITFNSSNWSTEKTITIAATEDPDITNGSAVFRSSVAGYAAIDVTVYEKDDDVNITINAGTGGSTTPSGLVMVDQHNMPFAVTATPDPGYVFINWTDPSGILTSATNATTTLTATATAAIQANFGLETITIVVESNPINVPEGSSATLKIKLGQQPAGNIDLNITKDSGDADITLSSDPFLLTFTTANWNTYQSIVIFAAEDLDITSDSAIFTISKSSGINSINSLNVTVNEIDNDQAYYTVTATAGSHGSIDPIGNIQVAYGTNQNFNFLPQQGYEIDTITVDGTDLGALPNYQFTNVVSHHTIHATFKIKTFAITISSGANGSINPSTPNPFIANYGSNKSFTFSPNIGYIVDTVTVDGSDKGALINYLFSNINSDHTLHVTFKIKTFTITSSAGANGSISFSGVATLNYNDNQTYSFTPDPGYQIANIIVDGVYLGAQASYTFNAIQTNHTINVTFVPIGVLHTITASTNGNGTISPRGAIDVASGENQSFTITPSTGYQIKHVTVDGNNQGALETYSFTNITSSHEIIASFEPKLFIITSNAGANGSITTQDYTPAAYGSNRTFTITANAGYHIKDVLVDSVSVGATSSYTFYYISAGHTISAIFEINTYTINASAGTNGAISPSGAVPATHGASQSFTITPNMGYVVKDVLIDGVSIGAVTSYTFSNIIAPHTIVASFILDTADRVITATSDHNGTISPIGTVAVTNGTSKTFTFTPNPGYVVKDVLVDGVSIGSPNSYTFDSVLSSHTIHVSFKISDIRYTINAIYGAHGTLSPAGNISVASGSNQTFNCLPDLGYVVDSVLIDNTSVGAVSTYTFTNVTSDHTILVSFKIAPKLYSISATAGEHGTISPAGVNAIAEGSNAIFTITPESGYEIDSLVVDQSSVVKTNSYTFNQVGSDHTIHAEFRLISAPKRITATATTGGTISPTGEIYVAKNSNQVFTFQAALGYRIEDVKVNGISQGPITTYEFTNIQIDHTVSAQFTKADSAHTINVRSIGNGTVTPSGMIDIENGGSVSIVITPSSGYKIDSIYVDGLPITNLSIYNFVNITDNHEFFVRFSAIGKTYTITASTTGHGSISPSDQTIIEEGDQLLYTFIPDQGYQVKEVIVDGVKKGALANYAFLNIQASHTITVDFAPETTESSKELLSFEFLNLGTKVSGMIHDDRVLVIVPKNTILTSLVATFTFKGAKVEVNENSVVSGVTAIDYTKTVTFRVIARDQTERIYNVTVLSDSDLASGLISFEASTYSVESASTKAFVRVNRTNGSTGQVTAKFQTVSKTAISNSDYIPLEGTLSWGDGDSESKIIEITLIPQLNQKENTSFLIQLTDINGALSGTILQTEILIHNPVNASQTNASGGGASCSYSQNMSLHDQYSHILSYVFSLMLFVIARKIYRRKKSS